MSARPRRTARARRPVVRYHFFAGKGGVGKTTCAAAAALHAADHGARVLAVSTDPAHSLGDALAHPLGPRQPGRGPARRSCLIYSPTARSKVILNSSLSCVVCRLSSPGTRHPFRPFARRQEIGQWPKAAPVLRRGAVGA